jgi:monoamine oxidase
VITERRATYACRPELSHAAAGALLPGLYLAGDYLDPGLPATLESAVRSGLAAAAAVQAWLATQP